VITQAMHFHRTLLEVLAGGPGSGCQGPNCGRPRGVRQQFQTTQGHTYTLFRPSRKGIPRGKADYKKRISQFKGQFEATHVNVPMKEGRKNGVSGVYDAAYKTEDVHAGHGVTVFVHKDFKNMRVVVMEMPHDDMNKLEMARTFKFKSFSQAATFLNKRYAIKQKLPAASAQ
jgi:hypothetical protein